MTEGDGSSTRSVSLGHGEELTLAHRLAAVDVDEDGEMLEEVLDGAPKEATIETMLGTP